MLNLHISHLEILMSARRLTLTQRIETNFFEKSALIAERLFMGENNTYIVFSDQVRQNVFITLGSLYSIGGLKCKYIKLLFCAESPRSLAFTMWLCLCTGFRLFCLFLSRYAFCPFV